MSSWMQVSWAPLIGLALFIIWIWLLVDCARRGFRNMLEKVLWILAMVLSPFLGSIVYLVVVKYSNPQGLMDK